MVANPCYLFTGIVFLILNVTGQLLHFYSVETLNKAMLLMIVGGLIMAVMILLNLYRVTLLEWVQRLQLELREWD